MYHLRKNLVLGGRSLCIEISTNKYFISFNVPAALTISNSSFCIYVFRMILRINSNYFLIQR
jgi:hypothetical protein